MIHTDGTQTIANAPARPAPTIQLSREDARRIVGLAGYAAAMAGALLCPRTKVALDRLTAALTDE